MTRQPVMYCSEIREWAVRVVSLSLADDPAKNVIALVAAQVGCDQATLRRWIQEANRAGGARPGVFMSPRDHVKELEQEVAALRLANTILRNAVPVSDEATAN